MRTINNIHKPVCALILLLLAVLSGCEERISINTDDSSPRLVIYGYITTDTVRHAIRITRSSSYFSTDKPEGISKASVSIAGEGVSYALSESPEEAGLYLTEADVYGLAGEKYTLHVSLNFDGEDVVCEASSILPLPMRLDSVAIVQTNFLNELLEVIIWGRLPESDNNHFITGLYRNGMSLNDSLRRFNISDDQYVRSKELTGFIASMISQRNERRKLLEGDTLGVQIKSITREYATFLNNARQENSASIPIFSGPPANVETNISCSSDRIGVSGFFSALSTSEMVTTVYKP